MEASWACASRRAFFLAPLVLALSMRLAWPAALLVSGLEMAVGLKWMKFM